MDSYTIISYPGLELPQQYLNMILSKWLRSLRYGNDYYKLIESDAYYDNYNHFIFSLIKCKQSVVRLAVLTEDPDVVLGWSLYRGHILDFIHVHKDMRNQGIGTSLMPKEISTITHLTKVGMSIWNSKYPDLKFNPFT